MRPLICKLKKDCFIYLLVWSGRSQMYIKSPLILESQRQIALERINILSNFFASQILAIISRFPNFGRGRVELKSLDQKSTDWSICQSQTHLALEDIEKSLARIATQERILFSSWPLIYALWLTLALLLMASILAMGGEFLVEAICSPNCCQYNRP